MKPKKNMYRSPWDREIDKSMAVEVKGEQKGKKRREMEEILKEQDSLDGGRTVLESQERDILIEEALWG